MTSDGSPGGVLARLRAKILDQAYPAGSRMAETAVAADLGVSRTPVRLAFRSLEQEGLLQRVSKRALIVREFSDADILQAVAVRGVLEGLAARNLAENGLSEQSRQTLAQCIRDGEALLEKGSLGAGDLEEWSRLNALFHKTILAADESSVIREAIARNDHMPFASANSIMLAHNALAAEYEKIRMAQFHHRLIYEALVNNESARVENLMREHANIGVRYAALLGAAPDLGNRQS
ncbi:MAG: GntR family transcriptional regulator [Burkholderiaceae bacterium]